MTVILRFSWPDQPLIINLAWILGFSGPRCHSIVEMMKNLSLSDLDSSEKCDRDPRIFLARSATHYKFGVNLGFSWPKISLSSDACTSGIQTRPDTSWITCTLGIQTLPDTTLLKNMHFGDSNSTRHFSYYMHVRDLNPTRHDLLLNVRFGDSNLTRHFSDACVLQEFKLDQTLFDLCALQGFKPD